MANARYLRGLLATARNKYGDAARWLQSALELYKALPQPYEAGQTLVALAELAATRPHGDGSVSRQDLLAEAAAYYKRLGAAPAAERASGARR